MSMNLSDIQDLIKFVSKSGVEEVEIEKKDFKITIKSSGKKKKNEEQQVILQQTPVAMPQIGMPTPQPQPIVQPTQTVQQPVVSKDESKKDQSNESNYITVKSPMIGTFYRSSGPGKDPFVSVGDSITQGKVICIVEAMKLFNEIESEVSGKIVKVLVDDASPVEYDQPLFLVDPS